MVEHLAGYGQRDLVAPEEGFDGDVGRANRAAGRWGLEVNGRMHSEIPAVPAVRLEEERQVLRPLPSLRAVLRRAEQRKVDRLQAVRFGSARSSVHSTDVGHRVEVGADDGVVVISEGQREVARHPLVGPGEVSIVDAHDPTRARQPARPVGVRTATERSFLELGPLAEAFLRAAAAAGTTRLASERSEIVALEASWGQPPLVAALERALRFRRFTADGVRAILDAGAGVPNPLAEGARLEMALPDVPVRPLSADALDAIQCARSRRLCRPTWLLACAVSTWPRCAASRPTSARRPRPSAGLPRSCGAPWSRPSSPLAIAPNRMARLEQAAFPVSTTLDEFKVQLSSVPEPTFSYLASLEWVRAHENLCLVGPAGTGTSHLLVGLGHAAVAAGFRVRYLTAAELVETRDRGLADNSLGRVIDHLLRADLVICDQLGFAPLDANRSQLRFRFVAAYERRSLGLASHWPCNEWGRFLPDHATTVSMLDRLLHPAAVVVTEGESFRMREDKTRGGLPLAARPPRGRERREEVPAED